MSTDCSTTDQDTLLEAALEYAGYGWRVVGLHWQARKNPDGSSAACSCHEGANCPIKSRGKHPYGKDWQLRATTDAERLREFWGRHPRANVGIQMGQDSGLVDFETDDQEQEQILLDLFDGDLPVTPSFTSGRGRHYLFQWRSDLPGGAVINVGTLCIRVGNEALGSQSVFPPSEHPSGKRYQWVMHPSDCPPQPIPDTVVAKLKAPAKSVINVITTTANGNGKEPRPADHWAKVLAGVPEGSRDSSMISVIGKLLRDARDLDSESTIQVIWQSVVAINERNKPPLEESALRSDFTSILKAEQKRRVSEQAPAEWQEIVRFDADDLPEFPVDILPPVLAEFVKAESVATQVPLDLPGLLTLAICSACIARKVEIEPWAGWREPVNLFVAVVLDPANRKSANFADVVEPLKTFEAQWIEISRPAVARAESERRQKEQRLKKAERLAAEGKLDAAAEAGRLVEELATEPEAVLPRLIIDDATTEKVGMMLGTQGGRIASTSPEGGAFDLMGGRYGRAHECNFDVYLKAHAGDDLVTDRVGRKSVCVQRPALTCAYAVQPAVIQGVGANPAFRGRGLLARFLYAVPRSWIGSRLASPPPMPASVREAYGTLVKSLISYTPDNVTLRLDHDALELFTKWMAEIEVMLADGGPLEGIRDWGGKLAGATLRLAGVMHMAQHDHTTEISKITIKGAVDIASYLIPHAEKVLTLMAVPEISSEDDAKWVLRWIERHKLHEFSKRDVQQHGKRRFQLAEDVDQPIKELITRGYIRQKVISTTGPGRPASPTYEVHPAAFLKR